MNYVPYTGIGSRETPEEILIQMRDIAWLLAKQGYILRSGGADGADTAFETGARGLRTEIYLPWKGFNKNLSPLYQVSFEAQEQASDIIGYWDTLNHASQLLHGRNVHQVLGQDLQTPSKFVVCWTKKGMEVGGTATAIKIAHANDINVYNLYHREDLEILYANYLPGFHP